MPSATPAGVEAHKELVRSGTKAKLKNSLCLMIKNNPWKRQKFGIWYFKEADGSPDGSVSTRYSELIQEGRIESKYDDEKRKIYKYVEPKFQSAQKLKAEKDECLSMWNRLHNSIGKFNSYVNKVYPEKKCYYVIIKRGLE